MATTKKSAVKSILTVSPQYKAFTISFDCVAPKNENTRLYK